MAMTPDGCSICGGTYFYISSHKCVACMKRFGLARTEKRAAISLRGRSGVVHGFLMFGTVAHKILLHLDKSGPSTHAEIQRAVDTVVSTDIRRMLAAGFIEVIGEVREALSRPCKAYDIPGRSEKLPKVKRLTKKEMYVNYRKRRQTRVASVFEFRGKISINERKAA